MSIWEVARLQFNRRVNDKENIWHAGDQLTQRLEQCEGLRSLTIGDRWLPASFASLLPKSLTRLSLAIEDDLIPVDVIRSLVQLDLSILKLRVILDSEIVEALASSTTITKLTLLDGGISGHADISSLARNTTLTYLKVNFRARGANNAEVTALMTNTTLTTLILEADWDHGSKITLPRNDTLTHLELSSSMIKLSSSTLEWLSVNTSLIKLSLRTECDKLWKRPSSGGLFDHKTLLWFDTGCIYRGRGKPCPLMKQMTMIVKRNRKHQAVRFYQLIALLAQYYSVTRE